MRVSLSADAQLVVTETLLLSDFDTTGLEVEWLALLERTETGEALYACVQHVVVLIHRWMASSV